MHGSMSRADLRQLEDVLLAVDDLEAATRQPSSHIASVQPAILVQHLPSLLLILEVPLENGGAPHTDLQSRVPSSSTTQKEILTNKGTVIMCLGHSVLRGVAGRVQTGIAVM